MPGEAEDATFRDMTPNDIAAGRALSRQSGWNQTEADWRLLMEQPSIFQVALLGGRVVGSAGSVVYGDRLAWVCMVLVEPAARGRGLGTRLVQQVLDRLPRVDAVGLDATPKGRLVYEGLGFSGVASLSRFETRAQVPGGRLPRGTRPVRQADLPGILAQDRDVFGADRERVLRYALDAFPEYARCLDGANGVAAYCFGRGGENAAQIGPIVASGVPEARDLVASCLSRTPGERVYLDAPARAAWCAALSDLGFKEQRLFTRMYRDGVRSVGRPESSHAIFGPEFA